MTPLLSKTSSYSSRFICIGCYLPANVNSLIRSVHAAAHATPVLIVICMLCERPKEAAREVFTDSMLGMTGTIYALVRDNLADGCSADEQLEFMQDKCTQAAELLGLHNKAQRSHTNAILL